MAFHRLKQYYTTCSNGIWIILIPSSFIRQCTLQVLVFVNATQLSKVVAVKVRTFHKSGWNEYLGQPLLQLARYSLRRYDHHELKYSVLFAISSDKYGNYWYMYVFPRFIQEVACTQIRYPILLNLEVETQHFRWLKLLLVVYHLWYSSILYCVGLLRPNLLVTLQSLQWQLYILLRNPYLFIFLKV